MVHECGNSQKVPGRIIALRLLVRHFIVEARLAAVEQCGSDPEWEEEEEEAEEEAEGRGRGKREEGRDRGSRREPRTCLCLCLHQCVELYAHVYVCLRSKFLQINHN